MKRALVVDDDEMILELCERFISKSDELDYLVHPACNGKEALSIFEQEGEMYHPFDFVLTDKDMPGMGGVNLMQKLRNEYNYNNPIILMTGNEPNSGYLQGFDGLLYKPFKKAQLEETIRNTVEYQNQS